jgi:Radical SAM superfamily/B12 binding domain
VICMKPINLVNLPSESVRTPEEHCGLASLHAYLTSKEIKVDITDGYVLNYSFQDCFNALSTWIELHPDGVIGFSPHVTSENTFKELGHQLRKNYPDLILVAGGHFASLNKETFLSRYPWLNAIIIGEGEETLYDFLKSNSFNVAGIYSRENHFQMRERMKNLDVLPFQTRYIPLENFKHQPISLVTSRGCYGNCSFCSISSFYKLSPGSFQTCRSADSVVQEIENLYNQGIRYFKIVDDNFFRIHDHDNQFLERMVNLIKVKALDIRFRLSARPNDLTDERCRLLKDMGAIVVAIGGESANEESLNLFRKGIKVNDTVRAIQLLEKYQIRCLLNFINFDPILSLEGLIKNVKFLTKYANSCIYHRINSHLWLRQTDPMVHILKDYDLLGQIDFPYVGYHYKHKVIENIKEYFDMWCHSSMKEYYHVVDKLMAPTEEFNVYLWNEYQKFINKDLEILQKLIDMAKLNELNQSQVMKFLNKEGVFDGDSDSSKHLLI